MFQDQVGFIVEAGYSIDYILDMDMLSFEALHAGCSRRNAEKMLADFLMIRVAFGGDKNSVRDFTKPLQDAAKTDLKPDDANDAAEFLRRFGGGI